MSDKQLKSEIDLLIKNSGYKKSKELICSVVRIISMRYQDLPQDQICKVTKSIF